MILYKDAPEKADFLISEWQKRTGMDHQNGRRNQNNDRHQKASLQK